MTPIPWSRKPPNLKRVAAAAVPRLPSLHALLIQLAATGVVAAALLCWAGVGRPAPSLMLAAVLQGTLAAAAARVSGMADWWLPIHLLFVPGLLLVHGLSLPATPFLLCALLLLGVHGATFLTQVPNHPSRAGAIAALAAVLPERPQLRLVDLGCGFGGVLHGLAKQGTAARLFGVERAWLPFLAAWLRSRASGGAYRVRHGDLWTLDLGAYDVVFAYLSPAPMQRLWEKAGREMQPGSMLISNRFGIPGVPPTRVLATGAGRDDRLLIWRIGGAP